MEPPTERQTDLFSNASLGDLHIEQQSLRSRFLERITHRSHAILKAKQRARDTAEAINLEFGDVVCEEDTEKLAANWWRFATFICYIARSINIETTHSLLAEELVTADNTLSDSYLNIADRLLGASEEYLIYERIAGCFGNMILLADAVMDEQQPYQRFISFLFRGCYECANNPDALPTYLERIPRDNRFKKAIAALTYAQKIGQALQDLEILYDKLGVNTFARSKERFLTTCKAVMTLESDDYCLSKQIFPEIALYEIRAVQKVSLPFLAMLDIVVPHTDQEALTQENIRNVFEVLFSTMPFQILDDISDVFSDIPAKYTISAYLASTDKLANEKAEFESLAAKAGRVTCLEEDLESSWRLLEIKRNMVKILWKSGVIKMLLERASVEQTYELMLQQVNKTLRDGNYVHCIVVQEIEIICVQLVKQLKGYIRLLRLKTILSLNF